MTDYGNFAGALKTSEFSDPSCNPERLTLTSALGGNGGRFTISSADPDTCYGDPSQQRVHMSGFSDPGAPSLAPGAEVAWCSSIRRRAGSVFGSITLHELHGEHVPCRIAAGPAPFNFQCRDDGGTPRWAFIVRGWNDCGPPAPAPPIGFVQHQFGAPSTLTAVGDGSSQNDRVPHAWQNGLSDQANDDEWLHFLCRWVLSGDPAVGRFTAWACKGTAAPVMVPIVPEIAIATCMPVDNYPILSLYYPNQAGTADYEYAAGAVFDNLAAAQAWQSARLTTALGGDPWSGVGVPGPPSHTVAAALAADADDNQHSRHNPTYATVTSGGGTYVLNSDGTTVLVCTRGFYSPDHWVEVFVLRFNTGAAITAALGPGESFVEFLRATFKYNVPTTGSDGDGRNVVADWIADPGAADTTDWSNTVTGTALNEDLTTLNVAGDGQRDLWNPTSVNAAGWTGLRFGVSGGQPTNANHWRIAAREHATARAPELELEFEYATASGGRDRAIVTCLAS